MDRSDVVVIGGVAAGPKTAATLMRRLPGATVTLYQKERHLSYARCGLPYFASGDVGSFRELTLTPYGIPRDEEFFAHSRGFKAVTGAEVTTIDRDRKTISIRMLETGESIEHGYDKLVLATGAAPVDPPFPIPDSELVGNFQSPSDAISFRTLAEQGKISKVAIIGAGLVGCELAEAAGSLWGMEVVLIEQEESLLPRILDPEMAHLVTAELSNQNVRVMSGSSVKAVELDSDNAPGVVLDGDGRIECDFVFLALGLRPEVTLARSCGLEIGPTGGIAVNRVMQTSDPDIYAGGDCAQQFQRLTGNPICIGMGSLANRQGRVVAENLAGSDAEWPGVLGTTLVKVFDVSIGSTGLTSGEAACAGIGARAVWGAFPDKPDYFPEMEMIVLKMVYAESDSRLLGLQAVGRGGVARWVDLFSSFLQRDAKVSELLNLEHGYAPPYSEALDPLHHLAGMALAQMKGMSFKSPASLAFVVRDSSALLLDVRETEESVEKPVSSVISDIKAEVVNIPLDELRSRLSELDKDRSLLVVCQRGSRSYQASIILRAAGFEKVDILSAGLQSQAW